MSQTITACVTGGAVGPSQQLVHLHCVVPMEFGSAVANGAKDIVSEDELANHNKVLDTYGPYGLQD